MELEKTYSFRVDTQNSSPKGFITLAGLQRAIVSVTEEHLENVGLDVPFLMKNYGVSWVFLSFTAEIKSPILAGETLLIRTWHTERKSIYYRREIEMRHQDGSLAAVAATFSSILDMESRRICKNEEVLERVNALGDGEKLFEAESRLRLKPEELAPVMTQTVQPSWIDRLGHVNNLRYADFVTDALSEKQREKLGEVKRYEVCFSGELRQGEEVEIRLGEGESGEIFAAGIRSSDSKPAFLAKLCF